MKLREVPRDMLVVVYRWLFIIVVCKYRNGSLELPLSDGGYRYLP